MKKLQAFIISLLLTVVVSASLPTNLVSAQTISRQEQVELLISLIQQLQDLLYKQAEFRSAKLKNEVEANENTEAALLAIEEYRKATETTFQCGNGSDFYDGGPGMDNLRYSIPKDDAVISYHKDKYFIIHDKNYKDADCIIGYDIVVNIEYFWFDDAIYSRSELLKEIRI